VKADDHRRLSSAARQRAYRQRLNGHKVLSIRVSPKVIEAVLIAERLTDKQSRDRKMLAADLGLVLEEWSRRWVK
jgi:phosphoheptose isomerase